MRFYVASRIIETMNTITLQTARYQQKQYFRLAYVLIFAVSAGAAGELSVRIYRALEHLAALVANVL